MRAACVGAAGGILWVIAANVDRVVNGGEALAFALILTAAYIHTTTKKKAQ